jgi:hypothetical protein
MSISISQTDNVGLTVESDPLALKIASNLSDLASAPTARTNLGVPYATNAEAVTGTSSSVVIAPSTAVLAQLNPSVYTPTVSQFTLATVGTGAAGALGGNGFTLVTPGSVIGSAARSIQTYVQGAPAGGTINWTKPAGFSGKYISFFRYSPVATARVSLGKVGSTVGVPTVRSIGFSMTASADTVYNPLVLEVHNGTTLTTVTSSFTPLLNKVFEVLCYSDGAGNVTLYVNNVAVATSSAGPTTITGSLTSQEISFVHEISQTAVPSNAPYESYLTVQQPKFLST